MTSINEQIILLYQQIPVENQLGLEEISEANIPDLLACIEVTLVTNQLNQIALQEDYQILEQSLVAHQQLISQIELDQQTLQAENNVLRQQAVNSFNLEKAKFQGNMMFQEIKELITSAKRDLNEQLKVNDIQQAFNQYSKTQDEMLQLMLNDQVQLEEYISEIQLNLGAQDKQDALYKATELREQCNDLEELQILLKHEFSQKVQELESRLEKVTNVQDKIFVDKSNLQIIKQELQQITVFLHRLKTNTNEQHQINSKLLEQSLQNDIFAKQHNFDQNDYVQENKQLTKQLQVILNENKQLKTQVEQLITSENQQKQFCVDLENNLKNIQTDHQKQSVDVINLKQTLNYYRTQHESTIYIEQIQKQDLDIAHQNQLIKQLQSEYTELNYEKDRLKQQLSQQQNQIQNLTDKNQLLSNIEGNLNKIIKDLQAQVQISTQYSQELKIMNLSNISKKDNLITQLKMEVLQHRSNQSMNNQSIEESIVTEFDDETPIGEVIMLKLENQKLQQKLKTQNQQIQKLDQQVKQIQSQRFENNYINSSPENILVDLNDINEINERQEVDIQILRMQIDESEEAKVELEQQLKIKERQLQELRDKYQTEISQHQLATEKQSAETDALAKEKEQLSQELATLKENNRDFATKIQELTQNLLEAHQIQESQKVELLAFKQQQTTAQSDTESQLQTQIEMLKQNILDLNKNIEQTNQDKQLTTSDLQDKLNKLATESTEHTNSLKLDIQTNIEKLQSMQLELQNKETQLNEMKENNIQQLQKSEKELKQAKAEQDALANETASIKLQLQNSQESSQQQLQLIDDLNQQLAISTQAQSALKEELQQYKEQQAMSNNQLANELQNKVDKLQQNIEDSEKKIEQLKNEKTSIVAELEHKLELTSLSAQEAQVVANALVQKLEQDKTAMQSELTQRQDEMQTLRDKYQTEISQHQLATEKQSAETDSLAKEKEQLSQELATLKENNRDFATKIQELTQNLLEAHQIQESQKVELLAFKQQQTTAQSDTESQLQTQIEMLKQNILDLNKNIEQTNQDKQLTTSDLQDKLNKLATESTEHTNSLKLDIQTNIEKLQSMQLELQNKETQLNEMKENNIQQLQKSEKELKQAKAEQDALANETASIKLQLQNSQESSQQQLQLIDDLNQQLAISTQAQSALKEELQQYKEQQAMSNNQLANELQNKVDKLQQNIEDSEKKIEQLKNEKTSIVAELEHKLELTSLSAQEAQVVANALVQKLEQDKTAMQSELTQRQDEMQTLRDKYQTEISQHQLATEKQSAETDALAKEKEQLSQELATLKENNRDFATKIQELTQNLLEAHQIQESQKVELLAFKQQQTTAQSDTESQLQTQIEMLKQNILDLNKNIEQTNQDKQLTTSDLQDKLNKLATESTEHTNSLKLDIQTNIEKLQSMQLELQNKETQLNEMKENNIQQLQKSEKELKQAKAEQDALANETASIKLQLQNSQESSQQQLQLIDDLNQQLAISTQAQSALKEELQQYKEQQAMSNNQLANELQNKVDKLQQNIEDSEKKIEQLKNEKTSIVAELEHKLELTSLSAQEAQVVANALVQKLEQDKTAMQSELTQRQDEMQTLRDKYQTEISQHQLATEKQSAETDSLAKEKEQLSLELADTKKLIENVQNLNKEQTSLNEQHEQHKIKLLSDFQPTVELCATLKQEILRQQFDSQQSISLSADFIQRITKLFTIEDISTIIPVFESMREEIHHLSSENEDIQSNFNNISSFLQQLLKRSQNTSLKLQFYEKINANLKQQISDQNTLIKQQNATLKDLRNEVEQHAKTKLHLSQVQKQLTQSKQQHELEMSQTQLNLSQTNKDELLLKREQQLNKYKLMNQKLLEQSRGNQELLKEHAEAIIKLRMKVKNSNEHLLENIVKIFYVNFVGGTYSSLQENVLKPIRKQIQKEIVAIQSENENKLVNGIFVWAQSGTLHRGLSASRK
ncbi:Hypothetical_protein [Hexamita inflata]|uniref:Hypothetical_protein n=1 Tax=Hexamita inflata TaxID=28002 RepID=A0AA86QLX5_9EUKA|nr:Hypothetical protein HINF_LOCUS19854 [Hexamita inflata]CAI9961981.1 Hypothetical protein HINF_LOCUS49626 [Hexamita inflata]